MMNAFLGNEHANEVRGLTGGKQVMSESPVAYVVFNRPTLTARTFASIRARKPKKLFLIADGPRPGNLSDKARCAEVRALVDKVDWTCEVRRLYADKNLGLKCRVSSGLDWVFSQVDRAIVLEDDCLPHPDFFTFCDELLERYAENCRVWVITGNNFQDGKRRGDASYYFSKYNHCWGWATWRRAWQHYQGQIPFWPEWRGSHDWLEKNPDRIERRYWQSIFEQVFDGEIDSWAYPWAASVWYQGGLTATPNVNLVTNIGIGPEASHTKASETQKGVPVSSLGERAHPRHVVQNRAADRYVFDNHFGGRDRRLKQKLLRLPWRVLVKVFNDIPRSRTGP
jgi:hypothetical protein